MSNTDKPREWTLARHPVTGAQLIFPKDYQFSHDEPPSDVIKVIEKSAYDAAWEYAEKMNAHRITLSDKVDALTAQLAEALEHAPNNYVHKQFHKQKVERLERAIIYCKDLINYRFRGSLAKQYLEGIEQLERGE